MRQPVRLAAAIAACLLAVGFPTGVAAAGSSTTPLACTGLPSHGNPPENNGAGSTDCASTTPQEFSNADETGNGANDTSDDNPYLATGYGQVQGGHLAGTEGKADNKNPLGQAPNGTDDNRGYECDENPGIGNGNPAHTTCESTPGGNENPPGGNGNPPGGNGNPPGGSDRPPGGDVKPDVTSATRTPRSFGEELPAVLRAPDEATVPAVVVDAPADVPAPPPGGQLARTGSSTGWLAALGFALVAMGGALVLLTRPRAVEARV